MVCSPYVGREGTELLASHFTEPFCRSGELTFITDLSPANVCQKSTDPSALRSLQERLTSVRIRHVPAIHAKVYLADDDYGLVTSANLTAAGLFRNFEYGIEVRQASVVSTIKRDVLEYGALGADVAPHQLDAYCQASDKLYALFEDQRRSIRQEVRRTFEESFREAEDTLIRLRLARGPVHTVFAKTIEYLLRLHGSMNTEQLHPLIQAIHPDLCDNTIDRIIDGKRFGKKWKHAVRSAQQQLKSRGTVKYEDGLWAIA